MLNTVSLVGRLTADPEVRTTTGDSKVTTICLAVQRDYVKQGENRQTDYIDCVGWNQIAELIGRYLHKGSQVAVTGRLQSRLYEDKEGKKRKVIEVQLSNVSFLDKREKTEENSAPIVADEEDIPF